MCSAAVVKEEEEGAVEEEEEVEAVGLTPTTLGLTVSNKRRTLFSTILEL